MDEFVELTELLRRQEVGRGAIVETPFGARRLFYADSTATGRFVHFVEAWLSQVRPWHSRCAVLSASTSRNQEAAQCYFRKSSPPR